MNIENLSKAIAVMSRAKASKLVMSTWQSNTWDKSAVKTEEEFHACGNTACFAGHVAISPEWIKSSDKHSNYGMTTTGAPRLDTYVQSDGEYLEVSSYSGDGAIAKWLGVTRFTAEMLCLRTVTGTVNGVKHPIYQCLWEEVTPEIVVAALTRLRDEGEVKFLQAALEHLKPFSESDVEECIGEFREELQIAIEILENRQ